MTTLVTGATGNIGRMVVDHLLARGTTDVRALTIDPARAALPAEVEVARGYVRQPETLSSALTGVERMYLAPAPETVEQVVTMAREAGVRHIVDLSGEPESWWGTVTDAVEASGVAWTHLWPGDFMENVEAWAEQIGRTGVVREPYPDAASAPIAMDDIAAVAAAALTDDGHMGQAYLLTGPETLTRAQLLAHLSAGLGHEIPFIAATRAETIAELTPTMGETADWYVDNVLLGAFDEDGVPVANSTVHDITGRPATHFAAWARANAHRFPYPFAETW